MQNCFILVVSFSVGQKRTASHGGVPLALPLTPYLIIFFRVELCVFLRLDPQQNRTIDRLCFCPGLLLKITVCLVVSLELGVSLLGDPPNKKKRGTPPKTGGFPLGFPLSAYPTSGYSLGIAPMRRPRASETSGRPCCRRDSASSRPSEGPRNYLLRRAFGLLGGRSKYLVRYQGSLYHPAQLSADLFRWVFSGGVSRFKPVTLIHLRGI